ncbi:MAG: 3-ketoacyl-ACP reductase [actinobacterium acMicro-4]|nr:MAG: 3-ketoacyl-ACP reductase [actinobacterium acMicro-4]
MAYYRLRRVETYAMDLFLAGKTVIVTGGTKGIGRAIVDAFADEGAIVAFCARNAAEVAQAETDLRDKGAQAFGTALDVADPGALRSWVDTTAKARGGIDMVVANASALAVADDDASWAACFQVDLMGTVNLCRAAVPHMENSTVKSLVALSSVSGREASFSSGPYGSVKSAIISYMAGLALSLANKGIRANTVSPGHTYIEGGTWQEHERDNPELFSHAMALNPTGRMGKAEEVAAGVVFLSSPRASRISGTNLVIDGAMTRGIQF